MEILPVLFFLLGTLHGIRAPDCDHDGVPDDEDVDDDNDGEVDEGEPCGDSDGDGVLNKDDPDYNEPQFESSDEDGDGESEEAVRGCQALQRVSTMGSSHRSLENSAPSQSHSHLSEGGIGLG